MATVETLFKYQLKGLKRQNLNNYHKTPIFEDKRNSNGEKQIVLLMNLHSLSFQDRYFEPCFRSH